MNKQKPASEIANYFIELASRVDENDLTNLKLQKLLYFAQGKYLAETGKPLFEDKIEAWQYGPVVRNIYMNFKACGSFPITAFDKPVKKANIDDQTKKFLEGIWNSYAKYSANYLVKETHKNGSPWKEIYDPSIDKEIPQELLKSYFATA